MKKVELILLCALLLLCVFLAKAQNGLSAENFQVAVVNEQNEHLEGAVVELLQKADQKLLRSAVTNKNGLSFFTSSSPLIRCCGSVMWATKQPCSHRPGTGGHQKISLVLPTAAKHWGMLNVEQGILNVDRRILRHSIFLVQHSTFHIPISRIFLYQNRLL